jgi:low temperature requirement protein LtrA
MNAPAPSPATTVTPVEVFFDLVFVFTLTQLSHVLQGHLTLAELGRTLLVFGALWYMYSGYAWLTNHVPPRAPSRKLMLFAGMAGFFLAAMGIPRAFDGAGVLFGIGFLVVVGVHLLLFWQSDARAGLARLGPYNVAGALLILAAGYFTGVAEYGLWIAGLFTMVVLPYLVPRWSWVGQAQSFHLAPAHFAERHGVLVMIALGESVIATGMGIEYASASIRVIAVIVLALALPATIWWSYFTDYARGEHALAEARGDARSLLAVKAYYLAHIPILLGIVLTAAGVHAAVAHPGTPSTWPTALALSGGTALFLLGQVAFRRAMRIEGARGRLLTAGLLLAAAGLGVGGTGGILLAAVVALMVLLLRVTRPEHLNTPA